MSNTNQSKEEGSFSGGAAAGVDGADEAKLWKARYYELRHTMQDWHAQALAAGFDGTSEVLLIAAEAAKLFSALNAMLTYFGMDEDEWSRPTFKQAKEAIAQYNAARATLSSQSGSFSGGDLHAAIMNLPCIPPDNGTENFKSYQHGHRDARHAAAELVGSFSCGTEALKRAREALEFYANPTVYEPDWRGRRRRITFVAEGAIAAIDAALSSQSTSAPATDERQAFNEWLAKRESGKGYPADLWEAWQARSVLSSQSEADESTKEPDGMRAAFMAWVESQGCDTDGAWSAWQGCWNFLSSQSEAR